MTLYLASLSPRRALLLRKAGIRHRILKAFYKESSPPGMGPAPAVRKNAIGKALAAASKIEKGLIVAADTVVSFKGKIIGKPASRRHAEKILLSLQGQWHAVYTGVALLEVDGGKVKKKVLFHEKTMVKLKPMSLPAIRGYFRRVDPMDKAGAYAIQARSGSVVESVRGSFSNAVGLPMESLCARMKKL